MTTNTKQQTAIDKAKATAEQWEAQAEEWRSRRGICRRLS